MDTSTRSTARTVGVAVRALILFTIVLGVGYTAVVTGIGQLAMPGPADGSLVRSGDGQVVGSALIGQSFSDAAGRPLPQYFQPRPSAAGAGYAPTASGGSNLGPDDPALVQRIAARRAQVAAFDGVPAGEVPADAVTASGSGLDPDISVAYALIQVDRVARARLLPVTTVRALVEAHVQPPDLGYLGERRVNVLELDLALDGMSHDAQKG